MKSRANTFIYPLKKSLYFNITNRCTNNCHFCIKNYREGVGGFNLWLEREPTGEELIEAIDPLPKYKEYVFCGYGEPLFRLAEVLEVSRYVKDRGGYVRINTNGQANLIHGYSIPPLLEDLVDAMSISLNASNQEEYNQICHPQDPGLAYPSILQFIEESQEYIKDIQLSVVDGSGVNIQKAKEKAQELDLPLLIR